MLAICACCPAGYPVRGIATGAMVQAAKQEISLWWDVWYLFLFCMRQIKTCHWSLKKHSFLIRHKISSEDAMKCYIAKLFRNGAPIIFHFPPVVIGAVLVQMVFATVGSRKASVMTVVHVSCTLKHHGRYFGRTICSDVTPRQPSKAAGKGN